MSGVIIRDPLHSHGAEVLANGSLKVQGVAESASSHVSLEEGLVFCVYNRHAFAAANTNEPLLILKNNSSRIMVISKVLMSTTGTNTKFEIFRGGTYVSGGRATTAFNMNGGSGNTWDITGSYDGDTTLVLSGLVSTGAGANEYVDFRLAANGTSTFLWDTKDSFIIPSGGNIAIQCESTAIGDKARCSIFFYDGEHD